MLVGPRRSLAVGRYIVSATTPFLPEDLAQLRTAGSPLARLVGSKGYHAETFAGEPYPVE